MGTVGGLRASTPLARRRLAQAVAARQLRDRERRLAPLPANGRGGTGVFV